MPVRSEAAIISCRSSEQTVTGFSLMTLDYQRVDVIELKLLSEYRLPEFIADSVAACRTLLERNHIARQDLMGISYCMGGIVDETTGIIRYAATSPEWGHNIELQRMISEALGFQTRLCIDNVCKICARTMVSHDDINQKNVAVFYCDYGIGITFIEEGTIRQTTHKVAHEWGHMVMDPWDKERCGCGSYGCIEVLLSERRMLDKINALSEEQRGAVLRGYEDNEDVRIHIMRKSDEGNADALDLMHYMADMLGNTVRNVYLAIDPDYIVLLGPFAHCTDSFLSRVRDKARENLYLTDIDIDLRRYPKSIRSLQEVGGVNTVLRSIASESSSEES